MQKYLLQKWIQPFADAEPEISRARAPSPPEAGPHAGDELAVRLIELLREKGILSYSDAAALLQSANPQWR